MLGSDHRGVFPRVFGSSFCCPTCWLLCAGNLRVRHCLGRVLRNATHFGHQCPQASLPILGKVADQSEDCLTLNIWRPARACVNQGDCAVMVFFAWWWIGVSDEVGDTSIPLYHGDKLCQKGVIVVTMNYRLGALGFLALNELAGDNPLNTTGNWALTDHQQGLKWLQSNVGVFGGDPFRIDFVWTVGWRIAHSFSFGLSSKRRPVPCGYH